MEREFPMATLSDVLDVIVEPRYDTQTIPAAGSVLLTFFQAPIGQPGANFTAAAAAKSIADTNMQLAGQLPTGQNFEVHGFRVQPHFALTAHDANQWSSGCVLTFTISNKIYLQVPVDTIPAGCGPMGNFTLAVAANGAIASHGWPDIRNSFAIGMKPLELSSTQAFSVTLTCPVITPVTTVAPVQPVAGLPVRIYMDGVLKRQIQ